MLTSRASLLRIAIVLMLVAALEALCRTGVIGRLTMIPPSEMVLALIAIVLHADWFWTDFTYTRAQPRGCSASPRSCWAMRSA